MFWRCLVLSAVLGAGLLVFGCGGDSGAGASAPATGRSVGADPAGSAAPPAPAGPALFRLPASDGQVVTVRPPAALFFFTSWCGYCKQAMPELKILAQQAQRQGWRVYGVNVNEGPAEANAFSSQFQPNFPIILDQQGLVASKYGVGGYPTFVVIDRNGNIVYNGHAVPRQLAQ